MTDTTILVGSATCGRAAAAENTAKAFGERGLPVRHVGCLGFCYLEPLIEVRKDGYPAVLYNHVDAARAAAITDATEKGALADGAFAVRGERGRWLNAEKTPILEELDVWKHQTRRVMSNCGVIDPERIEDYLAAGGYTGFRRALFLDPERVVDEVDKAGLRGRGGAGFPTGKKWVLARNSPADERYAICNADEGDPGAFMNRALLESDPHRVLEGLMISAYAIGARRAFVFVRAEKPLAAERMEQAAQAAAANGLLGDNIAGTNYSLSVEVVRSAGAFVCGEETALIAAMEGRRGFPMPRPPYPAEKGLWGKPTNINNVETLAHVALILQNGAAWFAQVGSAKSKGTKVFCLSGRAAQTGAYEIPLGTPARDLVFTLGGGIAGGKAFRAVQTGGPSGGCLSESELDLPLDYETLQGAGSIMGSGGVIVFDEQACPVDTAKFFLSFNKAESCGKCVPCREGTYRLYELLDKFSTGTAAPSDFDKIERLGQLMKDASLCGLGQGAPNPALSLIRKFRADFEKHMKDKVCAANVCRMKP